MRKLAIAFFTLALVPVSAYSQSLNQSRCNLTEATSPTVRGLRVGMSTQDVLALFPAAGRKKEIRDALDKAKNPNTSEAAYLQLELGADAKGEPLPGIGSLSVVIHQGRVVVLNVDYVGVTWRNIDEWITQLSEKLKLPGSQEWMMGPNETPNKVLRCSGIEIEAAIQGGGSSIRVRNTEYLKGLDERTNTDDARKRRDFKP